MRNIFLMNVFLCSFFVSQSAMAFYFNTGEASATLNASSIPKGLGDITSGASGGASVQGYGNPNSNNRDEVKIESVNVNPELTSRNFTIQIGINGSWTEANASIGRCVWYTGSCNTDHYGSVDDYPTEAVAIRLKRNSQSSYATIPDGLTLATVRIRQYSNTTSGYNGATAQFTYKLNGSVTPIVRTCDVKNFDKTVTLPEVTSYELLRKKWRYEGVSKEFSINLTCQNKPTVNVTFNGTLMPTVGTKDALANLNSGNPNVGIQILYDGTPVKIGEKLKIVSSAANSVALKFKAYYFVKGGEINEGTVRSQSEFVFNYE